MREWTAKSSSATWREATVSDDFLGFCGSGDLVEGGILSGIRITRLLFNRKSYQGYQNSISATIKRVLNLPT